MKPYGVNPRWDQDCCPGHSRFPRDTYKSRLSKKAQTRDTKIAHRRARRIAKYRLKIEEGGINMKPWLVLMVVLTCAGCVMPWEPEGATRFNPPGWYQGVWDQVSGCAQAQGDFARVEWYMTPGPVDGHAAGASVGNRVYLRATLVENEVLVSHEILHQLIGDPGHTRVTLWNRCVTGHAAVATIIQL